MDKEFSRYVRGVAARHSVSEMVEDDLFLSSLLTDVVFGVQPRMCDRHERDSLGVQTLRSPRDSAARPTPAT